jgi:hypothetical protein
MKTVKLEFTPQECHRIMQMTVAAKEQLQAMLTIAVNDGKEYPPEFDKQIVQATQETVSIIDKLTAAGKLLKKGNKRVN